MAIPDVSVDYGLSALISNTLKVGMAQTPSRKALRWSEKDLNRVKELLPFYSPKAIGLMLGRSEDSIKIKRQRKKIKASSKSEGWLTPNRIMRLLGMPDARPVIGWVKKGFVVGHRIEGDDTWLVHEISLRRWVICPRSWVYFDTTRIQDSHLARLVELAQERWDDEWLTTRQVADLKGTTTRQIGQSIFRGEIPAVHIVGKDGRHEASAWSFWAVKRSDAEAWQFKPPPYDLMDCRHAFILLARAIGLSGMTIGKMANLCHTNTSQRFSLMNNPRHLRKVIAKYGLKDIEYRHKVGVHADWRRFAHRFPQVRGAFERYRDGKATLDDRYLIARILKNQMAANGMKVNINAIGKVSHGTVDELVQRMRKAGIKPYLLRKPRKR
ncbi:MAG: hypothetical protein EHJ95_07000 [Methanobacteriota archaeon]|nr:MAG: hypothetical protein EHJ95_07000 [Euryarchaeota archaeon]